MQPSIHPNDDASSTQRIAPANEGPDVSVKLLRVSAWIAEHLLFAMALFLLIPGPQSEGPPRIVMTLSTVWITSTAFTLSCAIAWLRKQSSLPASLLKSAIFLTFAYAMYAGMTMYGGTTR